MKNFTVVLVVSVQMASFDNLASSEKAAVSEQPQQKPTSTVQQRPAIPAPQVVKPSDVNQSVANKPKDAEAIVPAYDPLKYRGVAVMHNGKLQYVDENASQTHRNENFVVVKVKGFKTRGDKENGRIRIAVWAVADNYAKEGVAPFRASSYPAKESISVNGEMVFRISGLELGRSYSFFAHFDKEDRGYVKRNILKIPVEPYIFSNAKTQGLGKGLTREGFSPPKFENTLVKFNKPGQEIVLEF